MTGKDDRPGDAAGLRPRAERMARERAAQAPENLQTLSPEETRRTLHELRVHQIELEMQNEELRRAQAELDAARARYFDLYDLAPAGYCTVSEQGLILEANLTAAALLGVARGALGQQPITRFILREDQDIYYLHRRQLFETGEPQERELRMVKMDGTVFWAHLAATAAEDAGGAPVCRLVISDIPEREQAAEALRESEERYRRVSSAISDVAYACCLAEAGGYRIDWLTGATERITGYSADELKAKRCWGSLVIEEDRALFDEHVVGLAPGSSGSCELRVRHKDGSVRWLASSAECVLSPDVARTPRIYGGLVDITGRKRAEEALARSRAEMKAIYDHAPVMMCVVDADRRVLHANPAFTAFTGVSEDGLKGGHACGVFGCINALDDPRGCGFGTDCRDCALRLALEDTLKTGAAHHNVEHHTTFVRDGDRREVTLLGSTALIRAAGRTRLLLCLHDITERKRAEEEIRASKEEFDRFFALVPDLAGVASTGGFFKKLNPAWEKTLGFSIAELLSQPFESFLHTDDVAATRQEFLNQINGRSTVGFVNRYRTKAGGYRWLEWMATPVVGGDVAYATGRDITERKRTEEEHERLQAQLAQAQKMESIGRLAGGVAHDFNNLLTVINGYSQLLLDRLRAGDPLRAGLEEIHKAGERAAGLTRQLLAFSRKQVLEPHVLDLNRVVEEMRPMLERLVGEAVAVRVALNAQSGTVHADPHQLEQVIMNLAVNARDAMLGGGRLLIETAGVELDQGYAQSHPEARAGPYVMLAVSDTGVGMDEETRKRIFEPFFTTKEPGQGTGLGLSMIQGIVAQSGGYIEVYSEPGQGTTFKIYLPALAEAAVEAGRPAAVPALRGKETVLVVEDQAEVREYAVAVLQAYGYRVIKAENAGQALQLCEREPGRIHLALTDVVMPNVSGRELVARLEKLRPGIKVLFMSGYTDDVIVYQGVLEAGTAFIQKPFSPEELAGKVRAVLGPPAPAPRILVADDEAGVRGFLRAVLEAGGYQVTEAADGQQALKEARAGQVDLVITDLVMPKQAGIETIQALRKEMPAVRIIAITGKFAGPYLKMVELLGADAVLTKPVTAELLLARVADVLKLRP